MVEFRRLERAASGSSGRSRQPTPSDCPHPSQGAFSSESAPDTRRARGWSRSLTGDNTKESLLFWNATAPAPEFAAGKSCPHTLPTENADYKTVHTADQGFPDGKESTCNVGDPGLIPGCGRSPGEGNGSPLQYSELENSMDRGACWATVHGVAKNQTQLRDQHTPCTWDSLHTGLSAHGTVLTTRDRSPTGTQAFSQGNSHNHFISSGNLSWAG